MAFSIIFLPTVRCYRHCLAYWFDSLPFRVLLKQGSTFCNPGEDEVDIGSILRRYLIECNLFALSVLQSSLLGDSSLILEVDLVADDHSDDISFDKLL